MMSKLFAASLVCLCAASATSFARADEAHPDQFQPLLVPAPDADGPFGNAEDREERVMGRGSVDVEAAKAAVAARGGMGYVGNHIGTPGTFTVVSDSKRLILLNTTTGNSWMLMVDNPGSRWEPIAMGVSKGGKTEIRLSAAPASSDPAPAAASPKNPDARTLEQTAKHMRRLSYALDMETERIKELEEWVVKTNEKNAELKKLAVESDQRNEELEKQLKEAKDALSAKDREAQAEIIDASEVR
jgi:hypothetical protein